MRSVPAAIQRRRSAWLNFGISVNDLNMCSKSPLKAINTLLSDACINELSDVDRTTQVRGGADLLEYSLTFCLRKPQNYHNPLQNIFTHTIK